MPCCQIHPRTMSPEEQEEELSDPVEQRALLAHSEVAALFAGASVLLTGATGFLGSSLLEKLLRTCQDIDTVYVIVRDKRGVALRDRLRAHLAGEFFCKMRAACPDYLHKVVAVAGDCALPGLGLSAADAELLARRVSVVFHSAATVRFDEGLRIATITNVCATHSLLQLARRMPNLKAFVHISSAYSNCPVSRIEEKFYPPKLTEEELTKLLSLLDDEQLSQILPKVIGEWPNTYSFTKAVAEDTVRRAAKGLPCGVLRPSIVVSTSREPLLAWVSNVYGPIGVAAGAGIGLMHCMQVDGERKADIVPVDLVTNATIACAWDTWRQHQEVQPAERHAVEPTIYNFVTGERHPITWTEFMRHTELGVQCPTIHGFWVYSFSIYKSKWMYNIAAILTHLLPALLVDTYLRLKGKKPQMWDVYARMHKFTHVLSRFSTNQWDFEEANLVGLLGRLGPADRKLFPFDVEDIDWECTLSVSTRGMRYYIAHEGFDNLDAARTKYRRLMVLHYLLKATSAALLLFLVWWLVAP